MNAKERKAHERYKNKEWEKNFSGWLLKMDSLFIIDEALITYSLVKIPKKVNGKKEYFFFDIIFSDKTKAKSTNFHAVSLSELLNAINVGVNNHKFIHITKTSNNNYVIESYTYEEMIPFLTISPFVFKFQFNKKPDRKERISVSKNIITYTAYPTPAIELNASRLVELLNLFGDYKNKKK